jgi:hypothetical protein
VLAQIFLFSYAQADPAEAITDLDFSDTQYAAIKARLVTDKDKRLGYEASSLLAIARVAGNGDAPLAKRLSDQSLSYFVRAQIIGWSAAERNESDILEVSGLTADDVRLH